MRSTYPRGRPRRPGSRWLRALALLVLLVAFCRTRRAAADDLIFPGDVPGPDPATTDTPTLDADPDRLSAPARGSARRSSPP